MSGPTTLLDLATQQRDLYTNTKQKTQQALTSAQARYAAAQKNLGTLTAALAQMQAEEAAIRRQLAEVVTVGDGQALLNDLEQKIIAERSKQLELLDAGEELEQAKRQSEAAQTSLTSASARLASAEAALAAAKDDSNTRAAIKAALTGALTSIPADANAALNTAPNNKPYTDAKARIENDIPADLIARARERRQNEVAREGIGQTAVADARSLLAAALTTAGTSGKTAKARMDFEQADEAARDFALRGKERFTQAVAMLQSVADTSKDPLTAAERARINDAALVASGKDAAAKEKGRDDARTAVEEKQAALDKAIVTALSKDPDADPNADADVGTAKGELTTAQAALANAETAFTPAMRTALRQWEAAVPDTTWRQLADFEYAAATLGTLKSANPAKLASDLDTAETALVTQEAAESKGNRTLDVLETELAERESHVAFESGISQKLLFSALRGDR